MTNKQIRQRLVIVVLGYLAYTVVFSGFGSDSPDRGLAEDKKELEFSHITHTGGSAIEKAAGDAGIKWGACHFITMKENGCYKPDYKAAFDGKVKTNFVLTNMWHTPPRDMNKSLPDSSNPFLAKDLFTVVRNPYDRIISEYSSKYIGYDGENADDPANLNQWILSSIKGIRGQIRDFEKILANGEKVNEAYSPQFLSQKHMLPQVNYVYGREGARIIDNVLHFENLEDEFTQLMKSYNLDISAPSPDLMEKSFFTVSDLNMKTVQEINDFYRDDFEAFGYNVMDYIKTDKANFSLASASLPCSTFKVEDAQCARDVASKSFAPSNKESPIGVTHSTTFLLGIFTNMTEAEGEARARIRETYLKTDNVNVCSLKEYISQKQNQLIVPCRIPYIFVVGGNPNRPEQHRDKADLEVDTEDISFATDEDDIVYLNIKENTSSGKSVTYFKWAQDLGIKLRFDFIAKAESSTLLDMDLLIDFIELDLPAAPFNRRMYGGNAWGYYWEGGYYATSSLYFMSVDLATYISGHRFDWTKSEDLDIGRALMKHNKPIKFVNMNPRTFWFSGLETKEAWMDAWNNRMGELPIAKPNMENHKICESFKDEGMFKQKK